MLDKNDYVTAGVQVIKKMPDWGCVQLDRKAEYPEFHKKEEELRLDSWMQIKSTAVIFNRCSSQDRQPFRKNLFVLHI